MRDFSGIVDLPALFMVLGTYFCDRFGQWFFAARVGHYGPRPVDGSGPAFPSDQPDSAL